MKKIVLASLFVFLIGATSNAQFGTSPWNAPSGTFTVPANVTSIQIECWGGGGGGGGASANYSSSAAGAAGGGGGGGAYSIITNVAVIPGQTITVTAGAGGTAGTASGGNGGIGGTSSVSYNATTVVSADGGNGGTGKANTDSYSYGTGGSGSFSGIGSTVNKGGNGAGGAANSKGGGGGGGGGTTAVGGNASGITAGTGGATGGGNGGAGANNNNSAGVAGSSGNVPGGGGGGGAAWSYGVSGTFHSAKGGAGAAGQVVITYMSRSAGPQWLNQNCSLCATGCYIDGGTITPARSLQTSSISTTASNYGYVFWTFNASADSTYYFDLCSSTGTADSWLRLQKSRASGASYCDANATDTTLVIQNESNGCTGTGSGLSKIIWTCRASGTYYLESSAANLNYWGALANQTAVLSYKTIPSFSFTCSDTFYDKGIDGTNGSSYGYNNNENWIYTYYPTDTVTEAINVQFPSFNTAPGDVLCVYDGNSVNAPLIGCFSGPSVSGAYSSSANNGSLTFEFISDSNQVSSGWQANVSCVPSLGVRNNSMVNNISIYPNPVKDKLVVSHQSSAISGIVISNVLGDKVYFHNYELPDTGHELNVDVSSLPSGIYFIRIQNEKGTWNGRFVKQ